jgi:hypothetical protein
MANVLPLTRPPPTAPAAEAAAYRGVRLGSRVLVVLFTILAAAFAVMVAMLLVGVLAYHGEALRIGPTAVWITTPGEPPPPDTIAIGALPLAQRIAYVFIGAARAAPSLAILLGLRRLFGLYARGVVFGRENARQIRRIGAWLIADAVIPFVEHLVQHALGYEIDRNWFHVVSLQELVLGALVFVIAEVMRVGHEIEQDRGGFV